MKTLQFIYRIDVEGVSEIQIIKKIVLQRVNDEENYIQFMNTLQRMRSIRTNEKLNLFYF